MRKILSKIPRAIAIKITYLYDWFWLIRITILLPIILTCLCAAAFYHISPNQKEFIYIVTSLVFLASGGFILNDISDKSKDMINHPNRPIASGRIEISTANKVAWLLIIMSIFLSVLSENPIIITSIICGVFLVIAYSWIIRNKAWLKNLITATLSLLPWLLPAALSGDFKIILIPAITTFSLVMSREILLDIHDLYGDISYKHKTIPVIIGRSRASLLSLSLLVLVVTYIIFLSIKGIYSYKLALVAGSGIAITGFIISWILITDKKGKRLEIACHLGKVQFACGLLAWWLEAVS